MARGLHLAGQGASPQMSGAGHLEALLQRLAEQHERFMSRAADQAFEALRTENMRLQEELIRLRHALHAAKKSRAPPPVPPVPHLPGMTNGGSHSPRNEGAGTLMVALHGKIAPEDEPKKPSTGPAADADRDAERPGHSRSRTLDRPTVTFPDLDLDTDDGLHGRRPNGSFSKGDHVNSVSNFGSAAAPRRISLRGTAEGRTSTRDPTRRPTLSADPSLVGSVAQLEDRFRARARRVVRDRLRLEATQEAVSIDAFMDCLRMRDPDFDMSREEVKEVLLEVLQVFRETPNPEAWTTVKMDNYIPVYLIAEMLNAPGVRTFLNSTVSMRGFDQIMGALNMCTVEEMIDEATRKSNTRPEDIAQEKQKKKWDFNRVLHVVVVFVTLINIVTIGVSIDASPRHKGWFAVNLISTAIYVFEALYKIATQRSGYFCGPAYQWNLLDFAVMLASVFELVMTLSLESVSEAANLSTAQTSKVARMAMMLRALRLVRLVRLVSILRSPLLRDLTNMLVGFVIGIPSLVCVLGFFAVILYIIGLIFRLCFGPAEGQNLRALCGNADDMTDFNDPVCKVHWMYGEEFFGTVPKAMFTSFRFMLADFNTVAGKSLVLTFSRGFGKSFDIFFVSYMVVVMFGLFNIITAIFVETTIAGLKQNDTKRKYQQQYELNFVKRKLRDLVLKIQELAEAHLVTNQPRSSPSPAHRRISFSRGRGRRETHNFAKFDLVEDSFCFVMEDEAVMTILADLDCEMFNAAGLFDTFDADGDGVVTLPEFVQAILKLRGDAQKNDIIASWVALRALHDKFDKFQRLSIETQSALQDGQRMTIAAVTGSPLPTGLRSSRLADADKVKEL